MKLIVLGAHVLCTAVSAMESTYDAFSYHYQPLQALVPAFDYCNANTLITTFTPQQRSGNYPLACRIKRILQTKKPAMHTTQNKKKRKRTIKPSINKRQKREYKFIWDCPGCPSKIRSNTTKSSWRVSINAHYELHKMKNNLTEQQEQKIREKLDQLYKDLHNKKYAFTYLCDCGILIKHNTSINHLLFCIARHKLNACENEKLIKEQFDAKKEHFRSKIITNVTLEEKSSL